MTNAPATSAAPEPASEPAEPSAAMPAPASGGRVVASPVVRASRACNEYLPDEDALILAAKGARAAHQALRRHGYRRTLAATQAHRLKLLHQKRESAAAAAAAAASAAPSPGDTPQETLHG